MSLRGSLVDTEVGRVFIRRQPLFSGLVQPVDPTRVGVDNATNLCNCNIVFVDGTDAEIAKLIIVSAAADLVLVVNLDQHRPEAGLGTKIAYGVVLGTELPEWASIILAAAEFVQRDRCRDRQNLGEQMLQTDAEDLVVVAIEPSTQYSLFGHIMQPSHLCERVILFGTEEGEAHDEMAGTHEPCRFSSEWGPPSLISSR